MGEAPKDGRFSLPFLVFDLKLSPKRADNSVAEAI